MTVLKINPRVKPTDPRLKMTFRRNTVVLSRVLIKGWCSIIIIVVVVIFKMMNCFFFIKLHQVVKLSTTDQKLSLLRVLLRSPDDIYRNSDVSKN